MLLQIAIVLAAIIIGARLGGIGLGVMGGAGLVILTFIFGLQPTAPPIDVILMIAAVIAAASCMQAAGGLDYMVKIAEKMLRSNPSRITIIAPFVTYLFTFLAGTGHVAYSLLPVIAEVAKETKIRPERPLGISDSISAGNHRESDIGCDCSIARPVERIRHHIIRHNEDIRSCHPHRSSCWSPLFS
jgi:anaerobic C4-dicarboxylate transporter DcuA